MKDSVVLVVDVETTELGPDGGTNPMTGQPGKGRICSIAWILAAGDLILEKFYTLVDPRDNGTPAHYDPKAMEVNGLTQEQVESFGVPFNLVLPKLAQAMAAANAVVGHNVQFDLDHIRHAMNRCGLENLNLVNREVIDTWTMAKATGRFANNKLVTVAAALGIPHTNAHNALGDVETTYQVYRKLK